MNNTSIDNEKLLNLVNAIRWLIDECDMNYLFANDLTGTEHQSLENLRDKVQELEELLGLEGII